MSERATGREKMRKRMHSKKQTTHINRKEKSIFFPEQRYLEKGRGNISRMQLAKKGGEPGYNSRSANSSMGSLSKAGLLRRALHQCRKFVAAVLSSSSGSSSNSSSPAVRLRRATKPRLSVTPDTHKCEAWVQISGVSVQPARRLSQDSQVSRTCISIASVDPMRVPTT